MISFAELKRLYQGPNELLVEVTDAAEVKKQMTSCCSDCWGAGRSIKSATDEPTGWVELAKPSPQSKGDVRTIFVCKYELAYNTPKPIARR